MQREKILKTAYKDYCSDIVEVDSNRISQTHFSLPNGLPNFNWIAPNWELDELALLWIVFSSQAFQFTHFSSEGTRSKSHYLGQTGSTAVTLMIKDCWPLDKSENIARLSLLFRTLPQFEDRSKILSETTTNLYKIREVRDEVIAGARSGSVSIDMAAALAERLPHSFSDPYLKKAQLAISAIGGLVTHAEGIDVGDDLTAFADYEVPRVLEYLGILNYSEQLRTSISQQREIKKGSRNERAIRAATVLAVEELANTSGAPASAVDNYLWNLQKDIPATTAHFTRTTDY